MRPASDRQDIGPQTGQASPSDDGRQADDLLTAIGAYWDEHIHDLSIATHPVGTSGFFDELAAYRFDKLRYLPKVVDFEGYRGRRLLEVGCGVGIDLARFAQGGAVVTGVDLAPRAIDLARRYFQLKGIAGDLRVMDGESLDFEDGQFDVVYAHGVIQYTSDAKRMVDELHRVMRPGGGAIMMVYNRYSWLSLLSRLMSVALEHQDAPVLRTYSIGQFRELLRPFASVEIIPERFPVRTQLHAGLKAAVYNDVFVRAFGLVPRRLIRPFGWHLIARATK